MKKHITHIILFVVSFICLIFEYVKYDIANGLEVSAPLGAELAFSLLGQLIIIIYFYVLFGCIYYFFKRKSKDKFFYLIPMSMVVYAMINGGYAYSNM